MATPEKAESSKGGGSSGGPIETISSPYDRFNPRTGVASYPDTPALRQLSEYARPHAGFSPVTLGRGGGGSLGLGAQCMDPLSLHYQLNSMYVPGVSGVVPGVPGVSGARERLELEQLEREKRERELRELRERELNDRLKEELIKSASSAGPPPPPPPRIPNPVDPHWLELQRRYQSLGGSGGPVSLHQFGLYPAASAAGGGQPPQLPPQLPGLSQLERDRLERLGGSGGYGRGGGLLGARDPGLALHHPTDLLARPYAEQLAHQAAAHEHIQRHAMMLERERFPHPLVAQHEEFIRQQRERELKVRALEEAARSSRPS